MRLIPGLRWVAVPMLAAVLSGCAGGAATSPLHRRLLSLSDLPTGWSKSSASPQSVQLDSAPCFSSLSKNPKGVTFEGEAFVQGTAIPNLAEVLASGPQARQYWQSLDRSLAVCRTATLDIEGTKVQAAVQPVILPPVGQSSSAYALDFTVSGIHFQSDLVVFQTEAYDGYLSYSDLGIPSTATVAAFAGAAVTKVENGSTVPVPDTLSITSVPVRTVRTTMGTVAYRAVGTGPNLVMIMGYSGTMTTWDRRLVDTLAQHHHVVIFDNAGIGHTQALSAPLSIDSMADQTSALIDALGLQQPEVLGWSMGSMIAQALAVLHPDQVHRLVLCASYPGNGAAVPPSRATLNQFESGDQAQVLAALFPPDQTAAQNSYLAAVSSYPSAPPAPPATVSAQGHAIDQWWAGQDPAGRQTDRIAVPTLIADGAADRLDPVDNSHTLARLIPNATLKIYPDAGHAFLFQEQTFASLVDSFLS